MTIIVSESGQTTVSRLISLALKDIGVLAEGETATSESMTDALDTLRQMIAMWQADRIMVPTQRRVSFDVTGAQSYAIGTGLDVDTPAPLSVVAATYSKDGSDYPLTLLASLAEYEQIGQKVQSGDPEYACYVRDYAEGTLYLWPQPSSGSVNLVVRQNLSDYTSLSDNLSVPKEYEGVMRYSLGEMLLTTFGLPPRRDISAFAANGRRILRRNNVQIPQLNMPDALARHSRSWHE